ncbi:PE family protein [Nocardia cyriacigeorgica]|uniref:PE family protein n=1 Tax=Nocardia cyriacigeorgica TaxID=135487 RepID=UPI001892E2A6|nr:PE family protein [Nocardia cyriacigeorgica]MBF6319879.1 PE family protein [Nocardia cyriacigeorgica]MBF6343722.1 PE family protein [Nocardia cyriacigeorgica]MBF6516412.1 PE family protein [Nocardia cyriacigeorgica]MBF6533576.1 PE family protein [Nocardia cyriacigeorgica]
MVRSGVDFDGVQFDAAGAGAAARELDSLADRLEQALTSREAALKVEPAGADEVSRAAAQTMSEVATSFADSTAAGVHELRKLAAVLRSQITEFGRSESDSAAGFDVPARGAA